jgi:hypothetical protein
MSRLSSLVLELGTSGMFNNVESVDFNSISKDHIGDILASFNNQKIKVHVFTNDDFESVSKKIIEKAKF